MSDVKYCEQCVFWQEIENDVGECRAKSPAVMEASDDEDDSEPVTVWPQTESRDWCGEAKTLWYKEKYQHGPIK
jgi:hypothetical protein